MPPATCPKVYNNAMRRTTSHRIMQLLRYALLFVLLPAGMAGCQKRTAVLPTIKLQAVKTVEKFSDDFYLSEIMSMKHYGGRIYACCMQRSQILCMDEDFGLCSLIGQKGRAGDELLEPASFDIAGDTIAVSCYGEFKLYTTDGRFVRSDNAGQYLPNKNFARACGRYYYSTVSHRPLISLDSNGAYHGFGQCRQFDTPEQTRLRNARFTLVDGDKIITVSDNLPYIELFDRQTLEPAYRYDYSDVDLADRIMRKNASDKLASNQYRELVADCCLQGQKLYLLLADNLDTYQVNKIIVFNLGNDCKPLHVLQLPDKRYLSFCCDGHYIYAFNTGKGTFEKMAL